MTAKFSIGACPQFAFKNGEELVLVTGDGVSHLSLRIDNAEARIVRINGGLGTSEPSVDLIVGETREITRVFDDLCADVLLLRPKTTRKMKPALLVTAFACAVIGVVGLGIGITVPRAPAAPEPTIAEMVEQIARSRAEATNAQAPTVMPAPVPPELLGRFQGGTQILPRPDFLKLPAAKPIEAPTAAPVEEPAAKTAEPLAALPAEIAPVVVAEPTAHEPTPGTKRIPDANDLDAKIAAATAAFDEAGKEAAPPSKSEPAEQAEVQAAEKAEPESATAVDAAKAAEPEKVAEGKKPDEPVDQEAIKKAIGGLVKTMSPDETMRVLSQLDKLGEGGDITQEMIADLPHEVARVLVEAGLVTLDGDPDAPGGTPYSIIRLSEEIMEKHRGKDGIANIPERNTWASTGNFVSIPLPGGGDIKTPDHIKDFGLEP